MIVLDLRGRSPITEFFIIATGTSARQMRTVADELSDLGKRVGFRPIATDGYESSRWIVIDFATAVAHVFDTESRDFYDLELLWGDCPRINWRKELGLPDAVPTPKPEAGRHRADEVGSLGEDAAADEPPDLDESDEEGAEDSTPMVVELADESTGSDSVAFVEIDDPASRRKKNTAVFPVPLKAEDADAHVNTLRPVAKDSLDEDAAERFAEEQAGVDPEALAAEDLPEELIETVPMGGVSAGLSSTTIVEDDEDQQRESIELDNAGENREDVPQGGTPRRTAPVPPAPRGKPLVRRAKPVAAKVVKKAKPAAKAKLSAKAQPKVKVKPKVKAKAKAKPKIKTKAKPQARPVAKAKAKVQAPRKAATKKPASKKVAAKKAKPKARKR